MTDIARLAVIVESREAEVAEDRLDGLAQAADRAESQVDQLSAAARGTAGPLQAMNAGLAQQNRSLVMAQRGMGLTAAEGLNLSRQMTDVGVTMAMGMNPFLIAIQQGPQVMDIFQQAAIRTGTTVRAAMLTTATATLAALAPLLPIIAAITAAAATVAGAWGLTTRTLTAGLGDVAQGMNLTQEQMERLEEKGVSTTATAGDAFKALGTTIRDMFEETFGDKLSWVGRQWDNFLKVAGETAYNSVRAIGTAFLGTFYGIQSTWRMLPQVIGDAAVSTANAAVRAAEWIVNKGLEAVRRLIEPLRGAAAFNPAIAALVAGVGASGSVSFGQMDNPFAGSMSNFVAEWSSAMTRAGSDVGSAMAGFMRRWAENTLATAQGRIGAAAGDPAAERSGSGRSAQDRGPVERMNRLPNLQLRPLDTSVMIDFELERLKAISQEMRLINDLSFDMARGLSSAFGQAGSALGDLLTSMSGFQSRMADIALAMKENRLTEAQGAREMAQAQIQSYGDMASAARGFFDEGSTGYRVLLAIEQVYRAQQLAGMLMAITTGQTETASSVAGSMARGAANAAEGASKMFASLGPLGFPAVAAMVALLATFGLRGGGGGGGGNRWGANDNEPAGGTATSSLASYAKSMVEQQALARQAQTVDVRVTADRDGLNAYLVGTADRIATERAIQGGEVSARAAQANTQADLARRQAYTVRG